jgi:uncharacterized protein YbdZ (MbtH family)
VIKFNILNYFQQYTLTQPITVYTITRKANKHKEESGNLFARIVAVPKGWNELRELGQSKNNPSYSLLPRGVQVPGGSGFTGTKKAAFRFTHFLNFEIRDGYG